MFFEKHFDLIYKAMIVVLGSITLGAGDDKAAVLNLFFDKWSEQAGGNDNYFEQLKAVYAKSEEMQNLFDQ